MKIDWKKEISIPKPSLPKRKPKDPAANQTATAKEFETTKEPAATKGVAATKSKRARLSRPRLPSLPLQSVGQSVNLPKPLADLYGDLRDRHLLPVVLVLIAALIVVPIAFAGGGENSADPAYKATIQSGRTATSSFTVVPAESKLTSPKRLAHRGPLDPFRQSSSGGEGSSGQEGGSTGGEEVGSGGGSGSEGSSGEGGSAEVPVEEVTPLPESGSGESPAAVTESTTTTESTEVVTAPQTINYAIDLKAGFNPESLQEQTEVPVLTKLPNKKNPALLYIGPSPNRKSALFLMTSRVTAYYGAARCSLDKQACQLIELKPGKSATFKIGYGEDPSRYKIVLKGIEPVVEILGKHSKTTNTKTKTHGSHPLKPESRNSKSQAANMAVGLGAARHFSK